MRSDAELFTRVALGSAEPAAHDRADADVYGATVRHYPDE